MVSARRVRCQRNLDQIKIPEENVTISDEVLGKGGFGTVYIADYYGRNAAAKVILAVSSALCRKIPDTFLSPNMITRSSCLAAKLCTKYSYNGSVC